MIRSAYRFFECNGFLQYILGEHFVGTKELVLISS